MKKQDDVQDEVLLCFMTQIKPVEILVKMHNILKLPKSVHNRFSINIQIDYCFLFFMSMPNTKREADNLIAVGSKE